MTIERKLRIGILGCARIVRRGVALAIGQSGVAELAAIASRDARTAAAWAAEYNIPVHYGSYEELIADPNVDAVYIPLPNELHAPWSLAAAAAGKHVLCEKPLGLDLADAEQIVEGCRRHGVVLMEAFMWRHQPRVERARQMIADGRLGELRLVKMDFSFDIDRDDWRLDPQRGGGAMYDLGCYGINAARLFTDDEPSEVFVAARRHTSGVDMTAAITLRFASGTLALLDCSFECPDRNRIEVVGTRGTLELPGGVLPADETELIVRTGDVEETIHFAASHQYTAEIRAFCASIMAGKLIAPAEDGRANMRVLDAARRSAASGQPVGLS